MKSPRRTQLALAACLVLGGLVAVLGIAWRPLLEATSVDVILTPEELRDPKLIDVVRRTQEHMQQRGASPIAVGVIGLMISASALAGLIGMGNRPRETPGAK